MALILGCTIRSTIGSIIRCMQPAVIAAAASRAFSQPCLDQPGRQRAALEHIEGAALPACVRVAAQQTRPACLWEQRTWLSQGRRREQAVTTAAISRGRPGSIGLY